MYCVHLCGLHVYCALVDLDSFGSPGVRPTPGLTSSPQVVCVCVRAYTSTHTPTTLTPAKIEKSTRQKPLSLPPPKHSLPRQVLVPPAVLRNAVSATFEGPGVLAFTALAMLDVDGDELLDPGSSGSPGVRPTPGLTSSTQVVCVCVRAYTSTHTHTALTPAKIEKYTRHNPYLCFCGNIASHANNKR